MALSSPTTPRSGCWRMVELSVQFLSSHYTGRIFIAGSRSFPPALPPPAGRNRFRIPIPDTRILLVFDLKVGWSDFEVSLCWCSVAGRTRSCRVTIGTGAQVDHLRFIDLVTRGLGGGQARGVADGAVDGDRFSSAPLSSSCFTSSAAGTQSEPHYTRSAGMSNPC
jgi:hypothetical protein